MHRTAIDGARLERVVGQMLADLGGAYSVPLVRIGETHGLYRSLHEEGPATAGELAARLDLDERYVREWLGHQAASGYVAYDPADGRFTLPPEQAAVFADEDSPFFMMGAFDTVAAIMEGAPKVEAAFRTGEGVEWGDHGPCLFCAIARFFRPSYRESLVRDWLPAIDGAVDVLRAGGRVADVGCGHGHSTLMMAEAFPEAAFVGIDFHGGSIAAARAHADRHGLGNRVRFDVATAKAFDGGPYDLVTLFDCLHDMGDPVGACRHVRSQLAEDGRMMVVEPMAADRLEDDLHPIGRLNYAASTMICVPTSKAQEVGLALGATAGEARLSAVIREGGFSSVRRAAETPFNMVLEARP